MSAYHGVTPAEFEALLRIRDGRPVWDDLPPRRSLLHKRKGLLRTLQLRRWIARGKRGPYLLPAGRDVFERELKRREYNTKEAQAQREAKFLETYRQIGVAAACERWGLTVHALECRLADYGKRAARE